MLSVARSAPWGATSPRRPWGCTHRRGERWKHELCLATLEEVERALAVAHTCSEDAEDRREHRRADVLVGEAEVVIDVSLDVSTVPQTSSRRRACGIPDERRPKQGLLRLIEAE
jgi:hypothetical protein